MADRTPRKSDDDARFFAAAGPAPLALSAFGTAGLVPLLLIAIIAGSVLGIIGCLAAITLVVWWTLRTLRVGYRLEGSVLIDCGPSKRAEPQRIDLADVRRTGRQRRDSLVLYLDDDSTVEGRPQVQLDMSRLSMHSAVRLRSVMDLEFGIDCSTWGVTGSERARRDRLAVDDGRTE